MIQILNIITNGFSSKLVGVASNAICRKVGQIIGNNAKYNFKER